MWVNASAGKCEKGAKWCGAGKADGERSGRPGEHDGDVVQSAKGFTSVFAGFYEQERGRERVLLTGASLKGKVGAKAEKRV